MKYKLFCVIALVFLGNLACTGDGDDSGYYNRSYDRYRRSEHSCTCFNCSTIAQQIVLRAEPSTPVAATSAAPNFRSEIASRLDAAKEAISENQTSRFKRIVRDPALAAYPVFYTELATEVVSNWMNLRNGRAFLIRLINRGDESSANKPKIPADLIFLPLEKSGDTIDLEEVNRLLIVYKSFFDVIRDVPVENEQGTGREVMQREFLQFFADASSESDSESYDDEPTEQDKKMFFDFCKNMELTKKQLSDAGIDDTFIEEIFALTTK